MLMVCAPTLLNRLQISASGTVINSVTRYEPRQVVYYTLRGRDGTIQMLISGPTDASLPRNLPGGSVIEKKKWQIGYFLNGVYRTDFPLTFYTGGILGALALFAFGIRLWLQSAP